MFVLGSGCWPLPRPELTVVQPFFRAACKTSGHGDRGRHTCRASHPTAPRGSPLCVRAVHVASGVRDLAARRPVRLGLAAAVEGWRVWPAALRIFHGPYRFRGSAQPGVSDQDQIYGCSDSPDSVGACADACNNCACSDCTWSSAVTVGVLGFVAVCVVVSAITVVSRQPFGDTGVVLPTVPVTTTTAPPPPPSSAAPIPPPATGAPSAAPSAIAPTTVETSAPPPPPPPPKPSTTHTSSTRSQPSSVHPTTHQPFPQETTDFLGPPGTNN